jgi:hypothetical protein
MSPLIDLLRRYGLKRGHMFVSVVTSAIRGRV